LVGKQIDAGEGKGLERGDFRDSLRTYKVLVSSSLGRFAELPEGRPIWWDRPTPSSPRRALGSSASSQQYIV
jgi:hypothetical protein